MSFFKSPIAAVKIILTGEAEAEPEATTKGEEEEEEEEEQLLEETESFQPYRYYGNGPWQPHRGSHHELRHSDQDTIDWRTVVMIFMILVMAAILMFSRR